MHCQEGRRQMQVGWKIAINAAVIGGVMLAASLNGPPSGKVIVVSPRWLGFPGAFAAIANAGGAIVKLGGTEAFAIGFSGDPAFVSRLYRAGALAVLDAPDLAECGSRL